MTNEERKQYDEEYLKYGDIIEIDEFKEIYRKISYKTLRGIELALKLRSTETNEPVTPRFIAKTDDDTYVSVKNLKAHIGQLGKEPSDYYFGSIILGGPSRDKGSPWYVSEQEYASNKYPPFACGPFYMMSSATARKVRDKFRSNEFNLFPLEDVQMGIIMESINVSPTYDTDRKILCAETGDPHKYAIAVHYSKAAKMPRHHQLLH
jgi:hypothetical protein